MTSPATRREIMSSIITNNSAMAALGTLRSIGARLYDRSFGDSDFHERCDSFVRCVWL